jgi:hypothetical protein
MTSQPRLIAELAAELGRPTIVNDLLRDFLRAVYSDARIMSAPEESLFDQVYELYTGLPAASAEPSADRRRAWQFYRELWEVSQSPTFTSCYLQASGVLLRDLIRNGPHHALLATCTSEFIYYAVRMSRPANARISARLLPTYASRAVRFLGSYLGRKPELVVHSFKVAGPREHERRDTLVIYCQSERIATRLGLELVEKIPWCFGPEMVPMTTPVRSGIGVSTALEPRPVIAGFARSPSQPWQISFGGLRCELIAAAIAHYNANKHLGKGFDQFVRFVCIAFRSYGLDPARPSANASELP